MIRSLSVVTLLCALSPWATAAENWIRYEGKSGPGKGKHVVLVAGDEEYRSEEGLPMLAKILSQHHGFTCSVLFSVDEEGNIDPNRQDSLSGAEQLESADAIVMLLRFRNWPDDAAEHFVNAFRGGVPIIGLRTSTHAFRYPGDRGTEFRDLNQFGENVLGEEWVSHWGRHKREATLGVIEPSAKDHPILNGVEQIFGDSDVYEAYPPEDANILVRGRVLAGMEPDDPPAEYTKKRRSDGKQQDVNSPMMPIAWTRMHKHESGTENKIFNTTMGAATDLQSEGLRRMVVNAVYWGLDMEVPKKADVSYVDPYHPSKYGFNSFRTGVKPADHELGNSLPPTE